MSIPIFCVAICDCLDFCIRCHSEGLKRCLNSSVFSDILRPVFGRFLTFFTSPCSFHNFTHRPVSTASLQFHRFSASNPHPCNRGHGSGHNRGWRFKCFFHFFLESAGYAIVAVSNVGCTCAAGSSAYPSLASGCLCTFTGRTCRSTGIVGCRP